MKGSVLVVEDEGIIADDIVSILLGDGFSVCEIAQTADEAVHAARRHRPDLVLMDIVLPGNMDGIEAAAAVGVMGIPVIFITAHSTELLMQRAIESLPCGYIVKPIKERELLFSVNLAVRRHRAELKLRGNPVAVGRGYSDAAGPVGTREHAWDVMPGSGFLAAQCDTDDLKDRARMIDELPFPVCRFDREFILTYVNDAFCSFFMKDRPQLIGASHLDLFGDEMRDTVRMHFNELEHAQQEREYFYEMKTPNGVSHWMKWITRPATRRRDGGVEFQSIGEDISILKMALEQRKAAEVKFTQAFLHSPMMSSLTRARDNVLVDINENYERGTEYRREELIGRTPFELGIWDAGAINRALSRVTDRGYLRDFEAEITCKSGMKKSVILSVERAMINHELINISMAIDITERKRMETALRYREEMLTRLIESASGVVALQGVDNAVRYLAGSMHCRGGDRGMPLSADGQELRTLLASFDGHNREVLATGAELVKEISISAASGICHFLVQKYPVLDENGSMIAIGTIARDITRLREFEKESLKAVAAERRRISQGLHDDLGQKLSYLGFLVESMRKSAGRQASSVREGFGAMSAIIEDAIDFTKNTARSLLPMTADPERFMYAVRELCGERGRVFNKPFRVALSGPIDGVDDFTLELLFAIIKEGTLNAMKHGTKSGASLKVDADGSRVRVRIENSAQKAPRSAGAAAGLGLDIMRHRATLIGADLEIAPGKGRFILSVSIGKRTGRVK